MAAHRPGEGTTSPGCLAAATALISAMSTDAWQKARSAIVALWQRVHPDRAAAPEAQLAETRADVLAGDARTAEDLTAERRRKLLHLLDDDPLLETELRRVLDEQLIPLLPPAGRQHVRISMRPPRRALHRSSRPDMM